MKKILDAMLIMLTVVVAVFALIFLSHVINGSDARQYWVLYTDPGQKIRLEKTLAEIVNNSRVVEVRFVQRLGQFMELEQIIWKRGRGFSREEL